MSKVIFDFMSAGPWVCNRDEGISYWRDKLELQVLDTENTITYKKMLWSMQLVGDFMEDMYTICTSLDAMPPFTPTCPVTLKPLTWAQKHDCLLKAVNQMPEGKYKLWATAHEKKYVFSVRIEISVMCHFDDFRKAEELVAKVLQEFSSLNIAGMLLDVYCSRIETPKVKGKKAIAGRVAIVYCRFLIPFLGYVMQLVGEMDGFIVHGQIMRILIVESVITPSDKKQMELSLPWV